MLPTHFTPKFFTVLQEGYAWAIAKADFFSGLTVAVIALPLAMAFAIASGASPDKGLVTAVVAGFLISLLGGSRVQIGGPTGAFVVVVFGVIQTHGYDGLIVATMMAGLILLVAGYARFGQFIKYIPQPVITGFTAGIAVIIASSQVKDFMGLEIGAVPADFIPKWSAYLSHMSDYNRDALMVGGLALALILILRRIAPKVPGYLVAIACCSILVAVMQLPVATIGSRYPDLTAGLPSLEMPRWSLAQIQELVPSAFAIAFLAGIEALLSAVVADGMTGYRHRSNQELVGQGIANLASAFFGGLPATGAIARTATNIKSGGKTPFAGMWHAAFLLMFMYFAMDIMAYVPLAALAAVLFIVAWGMSEVHNFIRIARISPTDRVVLLLTFFLTVLVDLTVAIGVGVTLSSLMFMRHMSASVEFRNSMQTDVLDEEDQRIDLPEGVEVFQINGPLFFGVASELLDTLKAMGQMPKVLVLRMRYVPYLDASGEVILEDMINQCYRNGSQVVLCHVRPQPMTVIKSAGLLDKVSVLIEPKFSAAIKRAQELVGQTS